MKIFFDKYEKLISSICSILTVLILLFGFYFSYLQLQQARISLDRTQIAISNSNAYSIQKDARDIVDDIILDKNFSDIILKGELSLDNDENRRAFQLLGKIFSFYYSVFSMNKRSSIPEDVYASFGNDFCQLVSLDSNSVKNYWKSALNNDLTNSKFMEMKNAWCHN